MHPKDVADRRPLLRGQAGVGYWNITKCCQSARVATVGVGLADCDEQSDHGQQGRHADGDQHDRLAALRTAA